MVEQQHVRLGLRHQDASALEGPRDAHRLQVGLGVEDVGQARGEDLVVVDDQDAYGRGLPLGGRVRLVHEVPCLSGSASVGGADPYQRTGQPPP